MTTNGVRECSICRTEAVLNTKRNHISVKFYLIPNPVPPPFYDLISIKKARGLFPST